MKRFLCIILAVILCFGVGMTAVYFQAGSIDVWYPTLVKPAITPPNIGFSYCVDCHLFLYGIVHCLGVEHEGGFRKN